MALSRDDRWISDTQGRALSGAQVWWCTQPAVTTSLPPSPLATVYSTLSGSSALTQPVITDGFGHAVAYMDNSLLYTVVVSHPLLGPNPIVLIDQSVGGGSGGVGLMPYQEIPIGTVDGSNRVFTTTFAMQNPTVWLNYPLIQGSGYTLDSTGKVITFAQAPQPGQDLIYAQYWTTAGLVPSTPVTPPTINLNSTGVGTGATVSLATGSTAYAGTITLVTGTSPFSGQVLVMTLVSTPAPTHRTIMHITPRSNNVAAVNLYGGATNPSGCQIDTATGLAANTTYVFDYLLVQI